MDRPGWLCECVAFIVFIFGFASLSIHAGEGEYATPEEAVEALGEAVNTTNRTALATVFGPDSEKLINPDTVQGDQELQEFTEAFNTIHRLVPDGEDCMTLEVGDDGWPFPIPLIRTNRVWCYDTAAGFDELLNRRIGQNELDVLRVMRAYVDAQREYASRDRDDDEVLEYAQMLGSTPGMTDGLYWPTDLNGEVSPLGPLVAYAQTEGYGRDDLVAEEGPQPFHGYLFKILSRQGGHVPGGAYDYIINGNMIGGFALVAWPAVYGDSGIMTFAVNQQGRVYQRDLGQDTDHVIQTVDAYDPGPDWVVSAD